jgi:alkylation response protein AidB-like acyl-CoA dehydrogenase
LNPGVLQRTDLTMTIHPIEFDNQTGRAFEAEAIRAAYLDTLDRLSSSADSSLDWPIHSLEALHDTAHYGWWIPREYGGSERPKADIHSDHEEFASHCLTTGFILSQREASIRLMLRAPSELKRRYFPGLATGDLFSTVGVSHLSTARQHRDPAVKVVRITGGYRLTGEIPWVTGADQADFIVIGGALPEGSQILCVLPKDQSAVTIHPPMELAALRGSRTSSIRLEGAELSDELVIEGPRPQVLGPIGGGGLETSNLAIGLARAAVRHILSEATLRPHLQPVGDAFRSTMSGLRQRLNTCSATGDADSIFRLRIDATRLALHATQTALLVAKGTGFIWPHPTQLWARQALFFLVWSSPAPVADGVLSFLSPEP